MPSGPVTTPRSCSSTKFPRSLPIVDATNRFRQTHDLLHQHAVHQFIKPIVMIGEFDDVPLRRPAGRRIEADALRWDAAEML